MIQPAFNFGNTDQALASVDGQLIIEVSAQSLNYILFKKDPAELLLLKQYRLYTSGERSTRDLIEEVIEGDELMKQHSRNALIVYNFPEASLVPQRFYELNAKEVTDKLLHGDKSNEIIFGEEVKDWGVHNIYRVPKEIHALLKDKFSGSRYWHIYTMILQSHDNPEKEYFIRTVFYHDSFIAAYYLNDQIQLIQTFNYQTPEDVAYYLLLICRQFNVSQSQINISISGLIDSQSALYSELLKYFTHVQEDKIPESIAVDGLPEEFPPHYFSSLLKMSLCGL